MRSLTKPSLFPLLNSGSILAIAIWVLVFFSILSVGLYNMVSSQIRLVRSFQERTLCPYLAKSAYLYFGLELTKEEAVYNTLYELRKKREVELGRGKFIYTLLDEESKININKAPKEILAALPGLDEDVARKIIDLRNNLGGSFQIKEEILLVEGITEEIYNKLKDFITVYGDGKVNLNTASVEVMKALGFREDLINGLLEFRAGPDGKEGTEDDGVFGVVQDDIFKLNKYISESQRTDLLNAQARDLITTDSKNFSLIIETEILNRPAMKYTIITDRSKIMRWIEQ